LTASQIRTRPLRDCDRPWLDAVLIDAFGAPYVVAHGRRYEPRGLPGFVAELEGDRAGALTYLIEVDACEIVTLDSVRERQGIGTALIEAVVEEARRAGCQRLWLITTNDNLNALRFYQKRRFALVAVHRDAVTRARASLKPEIPLLGHDGIPIRDEIELERLMGPDHCGHARATIAPGD